MSPFLVNPAKIIKPHLIDFQRLSYVHDTGAKLREYGIQPESVLDCSLGTNPYGCSPVVVSARQRIDWDQISHYPDPAYTFLKDSLSHFWSDVTSLRSEQIFLGSGSMGILEKINKLLIGPGSKVLGYCPQFTEYITEIRACGGTYEYVTLNPDQAFRFDAKELIDRLDDSYTLVYLDNPNNPTGQIIPLSEVEAILQAALRACVSVIVDEAYGDFMDRHNSALALTSRYPNLFVVRSFSKGSGLAGLRTGYGVVKGPLQEYLTKVDMPFALPAHIAFLAAESLRDEQFVLDCRSRIAQAKAQVIAACRSLTVAHTSPEVPILTIGHPDPEVDLSDTFLRLGVLTEAGSDFLALGKNYIRLRVPADVESLIERLIKLQA